MSRSQNPLANQNGQHGGNTAKSNAMDDPLRKAYPAATEQSVHRHASDERTRTAAADATYRGIPDDPVEKLALAHTA